MNPGLVSRLGISLLLGAIASGSSAAPDFSKTTISIAPAEVVEGDVAEFTALLRNTGDEDAPYADLRLTLPREGLFVDASGLDEATLDLDERTLTAQLPLIAGAERRVAFRVVAPADAGGRVLSTDLSLRYLHQGIEHYDSAKVDVGTNMSKFSVTLGGMRVSPVFIGVLAVLALFPMLRLLTRRRVAGHGPVFALWLALAFWSYFAGLVWHDWQVLRTWPEAQCTVLDSTMRVSTSTNTSSSSAGVRRESKNYAPMLALRYVVDSKEVIGTGFGTGSALRFGGGSGAAAELARWNRDASVACWYDPVRPRDVVVKRGFGGAYLFALFPLPLFLYGLSALRRGRRRAGGLARSL